MDDLEKCRRWLRARGIENPSDGDVERFRRKAYTRPYGSLFELALAAWIDSLGKYGGTRGWLKAQGLLEPSNEDLTYFSRKIRRAVLWRGSFVLLLAASWVALFWVEAVPLRGLSAVTPFAVIVLGLGVSSGTRLPKKRQARLPKLLSLLRRH